MTDKVLCPWCGAEMEADAAYHPGLNGKNLWNAWTSCKNDACCADGPIVSNIGSKQAALEAAIAAALHRYEPPIRPMTLEEVKEYAGDLCNSPLWMDDTDPVMSEGWLYTAQVSYVLKDIGHMYGKTWRCWPRKPTEDERKVAGWEDDMSADT